MGPDRLPRRQAGGHVAQDSPADPATRRLRRVLPLRQRPTVLSRPEQTGLHRRAPARGRRRPRVVCQVTRRAKDPQRIRQKGWPAAAQATGRPAAGC